MQIRLSTLLCPRKYNGPKVKSQRSCRFQSESGGSGLRPSKVRGAGVELCQVVAAGSILVVTIFMMAIMVMMMLMMMMMLTRMMPLLAAGAAAKPTHSDVALGGGAEVRLASTRFLLRSCGPY